MNYQFAQTRNKTWWYATLLGVILAYVPMTDVTSATNETDDPPNELPAWVVATSPDIGAAGVDPKKSEITITFDRDMQQGMSWTGGPPLFPEVPKGAEAHWRDKRTCVLPVKLKAGKKYRVGINSTSYQNFRSEEDEPVPPTVIYFSTTGMPQIVKMVPENGATDVDPKTKALRVTFNVPMSKGMSWMGGGDKFPELPEGKKAKWSSNGKTCILPVILKPNHEYQLGINSRSHINFQSKSGVPVEPVAYSFKTGEGK
ncbi:Ig-like domain-containing protein [Bythopirellula goksoeyrii]|uniref:SbsA Ig-like domain-containing protein n=1 Tax=Bythopirellula goksoeyrii TaxID=1400387 RepID=A0A5B9QIT0_9BACT|nr:Ig-like domain-containing protein [Bythopirellula goksoeyrii]QEG37622.1 hypothetical protein Pr1d_49680 [Bythopirellula goksoeyrii]